MKKALTIICTLTLIMLGCVTSKNKAYTKSTDSKSVDSLASVIEDSVRKVYEEKYREVGFYVDFYNNQDSAFKDMQDALWDGATTQDSLRKMIKNFKCPESTITYKSNGDVEVTGQIKTLSGKILDLQKSLDSARKTTEKKADVKTSTVKETVTATKTKKSKPLWWLYIVIAAVFYIIGNKYPFSKWFPAIKKFIPWV